MNVTSLNKVINRLKKIAIKVGDFIKLENKFLKEAFVFFLKPKL